MITVTKPHFPPLEEYVQYVRGVWASGQLTNNGQLVQRLERELSAWLGVEHLLFMANGTLAIQIALRAFGVAGEVITTPFSYVATTSTILWEQAQPVFVDIEPRTFCIDATKIEQAITPRTQAIVATHVYGYPCDVDAIAAIAERHGLKVIYDGAHAFGTRIGGRSLVTYGDACTLSFHATKLFHTVEGGALVTPHDATARAASLARSFGHVGDEHHALGINAKGSELHAAMGLCMLPRVGELIARRRTLCERYDAKLSSGRFGRPTPPSSVEHNGAYYPILFPNETALLRAQRALADANIGTRRYFFPSLNRLPYLTGPEQRCPVSEEIASRVLCLPLYFELTDAEQDSVCSTLLRAIR